MFVVTFAYPHAENRPFDMQHFLDVHLPMGVALCRRHLGIIPEKIVVYGPLAGGDGAVPLLSAASHCYFRTRTDAETFLKLFAVPEAAQKLTADFPKYTSGPPRVLIGPVRELGDMPQLCDLAERRGLI
jgi:hypothetical protein